MGIPKATEARQLLLNQNLDAGHVSGPIGASQKEKDRALLQAALGP